MDIQKMMKQVQQMQSQVQKSQAELTKRTFVLAQIPKKAAFFEFIV